MRTIIASLLFVFSTAAFAEENSLTVDNSSLAPLSETSSSDTEMLHLDCNSFPGRTFCQDIRHFDNLLIGCSGTACYSIWDAQINTINNIDSWYRRNVYRGDTVSYQIADDSEIMAIRLCSVRLTGDARYMAALAISYNSLVSILADMQSAGGLRSPYSCRFNVN